MRIRGGFSPKHRVSQPEGEVEKKSLWRPPQLSDLPKTSGIKKAKVLRKIRGKLFVASKLMNDVREKQQIDRAKLNKLNLPPEVVRLLSARGNK